MTKYDLENRLRYTRERLAEMGDVSSADVIGRETDKIAAVWNGQELGGLLRDIGVIQKSLSAIEAHLTLSGATARTKLRQAS